MSLNGLVKLFNVNTSAVTSRNYTMCKSLGLVRPTSKGLHITVPRRFPQAAALKLPTNVVDINSAETGRFSPLRERDITGPVISAHDYKNSDMGNIDITLQGDPHVISYDCRGAVNLSSSMQSNVPSPFSGNHTHLGMPGSQWGQGYKYMAEHLQTSHYLTLRNEYRGLHSGTYQNVVVHTRVKRMSTEAKDNIPPPSLKDKLKKAVKEYGATVIVFHVSISLLSLGTCYLLVSSGLDVAAVISYFNLGDGILTKAAASNAGTFVMAYAVHKVFAPARMATTLAATPFIVRYLRKIGMLKPSIQNTSK